MRSRGRRHLAGTHSHCLPLNCPSFVDPQGRFSVVEKLHIQLGSSEWCQPRYVDPVIKWLNWLRENKITPAPFKSEYIFFNLKLRLTAVKEMKLMPYDAEAMKAFVKKIAKGELYQKIVTEAGL